MPSCPEKKALPHSITFFTAIYSLDLLQAAPLSSRTAGKDKFHLALRSHMRK